MADALDRHHRRSIRLKGYDYSLAGAYFVTISTQDRVCVFGDVVAGVIRLNEAGRMVSTEWDTLPAWFPGVDLDAFVVMPNHIHGIIVFTTRVSVGAPLVGHTHEAKHSQPPQIQWLRVVGASSPAVFVLWFVFCVRPWPPDVLR
jgi:hypothetical protein